MRDKNGKTILLVDDEAIIAMSFAKMLGENGYEVRTAFSGTNALETAASMPSIDLILMDIDLGSGMDGTQSAEILLRTQDVPVVFLSHHTEPEMIEKTGKIVSYGLVIKSSGNTVLLASLDMAFKLHEMHRESGKREEEQIKINVARLKRAQVVGRIGYSEQLFGTHETWASAEGMSLYGFPPVDGYVSDEKIKACIPDLTPMRIGLTELLEQGKRLDIKFAINPADGSPQRYLHTVADMERNAEGKPIKILSTFQDVTESWLGVEALKKSEAQFRGITQNIPGVVYQLSLGKNGEIKVNYISDNTMKYAGLDSGDPDILQHFVDGIAEEDRAKFMASRKKALETLSPWEWEGKYICPDGKEKYFHGISQSRMLEHSVVFDGIIFDITERKNAEGKFTQLAALHQTILDTVTVGLIYIKDRKTQWTNRAITKMFGYEYSELIGEDAFIYYGNKEMYKKVGIEGYATLAKGETYFTELQGRKKDGSLFWCQLTSRAINSRNVSEGSIWVAQDIDTRKNAELALRKSESVLKATMESIHDGILVVSSEGRVTHSNTSFKRIFSIPEELLSTNDDGVLREFARHKLSDPEGFMSQAEEIYRTTEPSEDILTFTDGRIIERFSFPLTEDSPMKGRVWLFRDITERKNAERKIQELNAELEDKVRERTEQLECANKELETSNANLITLNNEIEDSLENLKLAQEQIIISEKMATLGRLIAGIGHELNTPLGAIVSSNTMIKEIIAGYFEDFPVFCRNLDEKSMGMLTGFLKNSLGNFLLENNMENREYRKAYAEFFEREGFENSNLISERLADIGCVLDETELREIAKNKDLEAILEKAYSIATISRSSFIIKLAAEKASGVVNMLRTYTSHNAEEALAETNVVNDIEMALTLFQHRIKQGVEVERSYADGRNVVCYPERLSRVWTNLIGNALQAMGYKGILRIETKTDGGFLYVSICDNGPGIAEEIKDKVFTPFFTTKIAGEGSGLGLDICKKILTEIGGKIGFKSSPGKTIFTVTLNLAGRKRDAT